MLRGGERGYLSNTMSLVGESDSSDGRDEFKEPLSRRNVRKSKEQCNMVMVDQLWLWILGGKASRSLSPGGSAYQSKDTVVTSFPRKWTEPDGEHEDDILDRLLRYLHYKGRPSITSVYDFATLITTFCTGVFDRNSFSTHLRLHDLFVCSIGHVVGVNISANQGLCLCNG